jgi:hypothetical protein
MSSWAIAAIGIVYFFIGCDLIRKGSIGLGISFYGYALGNVGLFIATK